jgi:hypothetical protein
MFHFKIFITLSIAVFFLSGCTEKQATSEDKAVGQLLAIYGDPQTSGVTSYFLGARRQATKDSRRNLKYMAAVQPYLGLVKAFQTPEFIKGRMVVTKLDFQPNCHNNELTCIHVGLKSLDNSTQQSNDNHILLVTAYAPKSKVLSVYDVPFDLKVPLAFGEEIKQMRSLPKSVVGNPSERLWAAYIVHNGDTFAHAIPKHYVSLIRLKDALPQFNDTVQILDIANNGVNGLTLDLSSTAVREQIGALNDIGAKYNREKELATVINRRSWSWEELKELKDVEGVLLTSFAPPTLSTAFIRGNESELLKSILDTVNNSHTSIAMLNQNIGRDWIDLQ